MSILQIGESLITLTKNTNLDNKTFPLYAPEDTDFPFCIYRRNSINVNDTKDFGGFEFADVEVVIASVNYEESIELAEELRTKLESTKNKVINNLYIRDIKLTSASETFYNNAIFQTLVFRFKTNKQ